MPWLPTADPVLPAFEGWLQHRPELRDLYARFYSTVWNDHLLPRSLLELCRLRIAQLHECAPELARRDPESGVSPEQYASLDDWERSVCYAPVEIAALRIADSYPWAHHAISDEDYRALREHLSEPEPVALTVALALFDATCRLRLVFELSV